MQHINEVPIYGKVLDNNDPTKSGRLKVQVLGLHDNMEADELEWSEQDNPSLQNQLEVPDVDAFVEVLLYSDNLLKWRHLDFKDKELHKLLDNDYLTSIVLAFRNLAAVESNGVFAALWTKSQGFRLVLGDAMVQLMSDNTVKMTAGNKVVHIKKDSISLGSMNKSDEPALMGDKSEDTFNEIKAILQAQFTAVAATYSALAAVAAVNPYTATLAPVLTQAASKLNAEIPAFIQALALRISKIKSNTVTLDK